jgi:hypothetical protein
VEQIAMFMAEFAAPMFFYVAWKKIKIGKKRENNGCGDEETVSFQVPKMALFCYA